MLTLLTRISQALTFVIPSAALLIIYLGYFRLGTLPSPSAIRSELFEEPEQGEATREPFTLAYRGTDYRIEPLAHYRMRGLVVSHNDIHEFADIYHTGDSVDIKDICVIWGDNVRDDIYRKMKFWSEPFSCWWQATSYETSSEFAADALSNTHLLSEDPSARRAIESMRIGDQVELEGELVNYYPKGMPEMSRRSSLRRDDTGNGACEVLLVENARILDAFDHGTYALYRRLKQLLVAAIIAKILLFGIIPQLRYRAL